MKKSEFIRKVTINKKEYRFFDIGLLEKKGVAKISRLPFSIRILVENLLRKMDDRVVKESDVLNIARWKKRYDAPREIPYHPARVLMQDFTGVPAVVDLAAMRDAVKDLGGDPAKINPLVPVDLIVDHSIQVDAWGTADALVENVAREYERNGERYALLKWAQESFDRFQVVPPNSGICHQVNLEYIGRVITTEKDQGRMMAYPDTVVGLDSHTTMINGVGVMGWGVGGIEAEAVMLGQPYYMAIPEVIGVRMTGALREGVTATDLVLVVTEMLRKRGVVEKFVEYFGPGMKSLSVPDRATIANMTPEYGATLGFFPVDEKTITYLRMTNRSAQAAVVEKISKALGLFYTGAEKPEYTEVLQLDLGTVVPCVAGPARPQDRIPLPELKAGFLKALGCDYETQGRNHAPYDLPPGVRVGRQPPGAVPAQEKNLHRDPERTGRQALRRRCGHRRHHLLHQHLQPLGPARSRPGRQESGRAWVEGSGPRENLAGARVQGGGGLPQRRRAAALPGRSRLPPRGFRLHDLHRQQRPPAARDRGGHQPE